MTPRWSSRQKAYFVWAAVAFAWALLQNGFSLDNRIHLAALGFFFIQIVAFRFFRPNVARPGLWFLSQALLGAIAIEGLHMFSNPVFPRLMILRTTPAASALRNYAIDLLFTVPVYIALFGWVWFLVKRYRWSRWEYAIWICAGQALGDGISMWRANPFMLFFLPYVMVNYQAMSAVAYAEIEPLLPNDRPEGRWAKIIGALIGIPALYFFGATILFIVARKLSLS